MKLEFQIYDYREDHEFTENSDLDSSEESIDSESPKKNNSPKYIIHSFGRTEDDKSVYCKIINYTPYFYIGLPNDWTKKKSKKNIKILKDWLLSKECKYVWDRFKSGFVDIDLVDRKSAEGFTNNKIFLIIHYFLQ